MVVITKSDYLNENKKTRPLTFKKEKIPTQLKSKVWYCRNCNTRNPDTRITCSQCGVFAQEPKLRRPMK